MNTIAKEIEKNKENYKFKVTNFFLQIPIKNKKRNGTKSTSAHDPDFNGNLSAALREVNEIITINEKLDLICIMIQSDVWHTYILYEHRPEIK